MLFDLDIDLFFTTEVTILADQSVQATPTVYITDPSKSEDDLLSLSGEYNILFLTCYQVLRAFSIAHRLAMLRGGKNRCIILDLTIILTIGI